MDEKVEIRRDLLPPGDWPEHFVEEVGIAKIMFDELADRRPEDPDEVVVGAYIVAFRKGARSLFFVQEAFRERDPGKDAVEQLAVACVMSGADELVMVAEAWMVPVGSSTPQKIYEWRNAHGGTLRDHPGAVERLSITHHNAEGDVVGAATINKVDGRRPFLTNWEAKRQKVERGQGRFQNLFLKAASFRGEDN